MTSSSLTFSSHVSSPHDNAVVVVGATTSDAISLSARPITTGSFTLTVVGVMDSMTARHRAIFGDAIASLLRVRDSLGIQLDFALGNLSEAEFHERLLPFLDNKLELSDDEIRERSLVLLRSVKYEIDLETLATILGLTIDAVAIAVSSGSSDAKRMLDDGSGQGE